MSSDSSESSTFDDTDKDPSVKYNLTVEPENSRPKRNTVDRWKKNNPGTTAVGPAKANKPTISTAVNKNKPSELVSQNIPVKAATSGASKQESVQQNIASIAVNQVKGAIMDEETKTLFKTLGTCYFLVLAMLFFYQYK